MTNSFTRWISRARSAGTHQYLFPAGGGISIIDFMGTDETIRLCPFLFGVFRKGKTSYQNSHLRVAPKPLPDTYRVRIISCGIDIKARLTLVG
jgi:hypothetical protein